MVYAKGSESLSSNAGAVPWEIASSTSKPLLTRALFCVLEEQFAVDCAMSHQENHNNVPGTQDDERSQICLRVNTAPSNLRKHLNLSLISMRSRRSGVLQMYEDGKQTYSRQNLRRWKSEEQILLCEQC